MAINRAIVYTATGPKFVKEALHSIKSVDGQYPCIICAYEPVEGIETFILPARKYERWLLDRVAYFNLIVREFPHDQLLFMDSDTYVCGDLSGFFTILDRFDIAGVHTVGRQTVIRDDIPASFPELHCGAFSVNRERVQGLFARWLEIFSEQPNYFREDQPALRQALWEDQSIRLAILPSEFCFRYRWGGLLSMSVKVLHGREHRMRYERVAGEVNRDVGSIRVYRRRELA